VGSTQDSRSVEELQITIDLSLPELVAIASALGASLKLSRPVKTAPRPRE